MLKHFKNFPFTQSALKYAYRVTKGHRLAGKYEIAACQRFIDDLTGANDIGDFFYSPQKAERACRFIEKMPHVKGRWAARHETLVLSDWQAFIVCNIFGWVDSIDMRRFRDAYIKVARKNGKSTLMAGIGHYMFTMDGEYGAEVYSGATNLKQAWEVFGPARRMAETLPVYRDQKGIGLGAQNMRVVDTNSKFEPLIGNPGDGQSPHCAIVDEYHEHDTNDLVETMETGMGAREQPLLVKITTSGSNIGGPCFDNELEAQKVLTKVFKDERLFVLMFEIDEDDDWTDPKNLEKSNPNIDVSVSREFLLTQLDKARRSPLKQNNFIRKHLNRWVGAHTAWLNMDIFLKCKDESLRAEDFADCDCIMPIDLASRIDITCAGRLFVKMIGSKKHYYYFPRFYIPEKTAEKAENKHYQKWINSGHLIATDGEEIDFNEIEDDIEIIMSQTTIKEVTYDPWRATQLAQRLQKKGASIVEFPNRVATMSIAMYELEAAIESGRFHYDGNPMLEWMASNVVAKIDAKENIYPRKQKPENKIDGIVAAIMGIGRDLAGDGGTQDITPFVNDPIIG